MPTYTVAYSHASLNTVQKEEIAADVARIHSEVTGASKFFAEVIFRRVEPGDYFIGGKPLEGSSIFVYGHIRAGRTAEQHARLMAGIVEAVARTAQVPSRAVWVYINELPPNLMIEFGHVLPEAGREAQWLESLPEDDRNHLLSIGA